MVFKFESTDLKDIILIKSDIHRDNRGFLVETYKNTDFEINGIVTKFHQLNHSFSEAKVLRGLHFQAKPYAQGKLVTVISGTVFDVAVDLRPHSRTFRNWVSVVLSGNNCYSLWIPEGFAHGFLALEDSHVIYLTTNQYSPSYDNGLRWDDPEVAIKWPLTNPTLSQKDSNLKFVKDLLNEGVL